MVNQTALLFILLLCIIIIILLVTWKKNQSYLYNGIPYPPSSQLVCKNESSSTFDVFFVNQDGSFTFMVDLYGNALEVSPRSSIIYPLHSSQIELFACDISLSGWRANHGTVLVNVNGKLIICYWGASRSTDWLFTCQPKSTVPTFSTTITNCNPIHYTTYHSLLPFVTDNQLFPKQIAIVNNNQSIVDFQIYSSISLPISSFKSVHSTSSIYVTIPIVSHLDYICIIAIGNSGGIQGTILINNQQRVKMVYLFGQLPLPNQQSIAIYTKE